ncbi:MAG TPA: DUF72 domain-containing protein [Actinomycetota bacterium]|jgi:uncharacterized protein YecE (DUF72 family)
MSLHVGTSGWAYKEWKPDFYPDGLPQTRWLDHYTHELTACEINSSFYRVPKEDAVRKWAAVGPDDFRFTAKAYRGITYVKSLVPDAHRRELLKVIDDALGPLGHRLGAVLYQLPAFRKRDDDGLDALLDAIPRRVPFAVEFRDDSWDDDSICARVATAGGTVCVSETAGECPGDLPPGPIGYVRLRSAEYSDDARTAWLELLTSEAKTRPVYAFSKHETGLPTASPYGGIGLARWLSEAG